MSPILQKGRCNIFLFFSSRTKGYLCVLEAPLLVHHIIMAENASPGNSAQPAPQGSTPTSVDYSPTSSQEVIKKKETKKKPIYGQQIRQN